VKQLRCEDEKHRTIFSVHSVKTPLAEKYCNFVQIFTECVFKSHEGAVLGSQANIISIDKFERTG